MIRRLLVWLAGVVAPPRPVVSNTPAITERTNMSDDELEALPPVPDTIASIPEIVVPLSPRDRCDAGKCTARALVRVRKGLYFLDFCSHHYNQHELALLADGWRINHDERGSLTIKRESSADA